MTNLLKILNNITMNGTWKELTVSPNTTKSGINDNEVEFFVNDNVKEIIINRSSFDTENIIVYKDGTAEKNMQENLEVSNGVINVEFLQEFAEEYLNHWKQNNQEYKEFLKYKKIKKLEKELSELKGLE